MKRDIDKLKQQYIEYINNLDFSKINQFDSIKQFLCKAINNINLYEEQLCYSCQYLDVVNEFCKYKFKNNPFSLLCVYECDNYKEMK
jgi:hypothetical protein